MIEVLDLFSAAAGGWSLGMHRAGFTTMAACEAVDWRRALYSQNNPDVKVYDDVCTLTAERLLSDFGRLPSVIVGSPPCQDISSANTKGKGVEGERSGLFFEAVRLIGECRPRWFALENSANLRTRGADAVLAALEAIDYACWTFVVRASDIGANHERPRSWIIGCDLGQVAGDQHAAGIGHESRRARRHGSDGLGAAHAGNAAEDGRGSGLSRGREGAIGWPEQPACGDAAHTHGNGKHAQSEHGEVAELSGLAGDRSGQSDASDPASIGRTSRPGDHEGEHPRIDGCSAEHGAGNGRARTTPNPDQAGQAGQAGQADGCMEPGLRQAEIANDGCGDGRGDDGSSLGQVAIREDDRGGAPVGGPLWSLDDLAGRLWLDDGLPSRVAGTRVAVGGPRGTVAASLIVEAYGDAVVPQIPEAIGRAMLRVEEALHAIYSQEARAA